MREYREDCPEHLVRLILLNMSIDEFARRNFGVERELAERHKGARRLANQIWHQAWHSGATWGLAYNTQPVRIAIPPDMVQRYLGPVEEKEVENDDT